MSSETVDPETPETESSKIEIPKDLKSPEVLEALASAGIQTVQSIEQIPAQLDLLNRVTLAVAFISPHPTEAGKKIFDSSGYNKLWTVISGEEENENER